MESPVVLDKPPEYHGNDRGFPFEEEEGSGAWSELAARHPDIAARLRQRPASATWARKRRPSSQDATDDFGENFGSFDRFPFDDIPPEFREHFPSHWNRRFGSREEAPPAPPTPSQASPPQAAPQQHSAATQTERTQGEPAGEQPPQSPLPQYGLRNTVDLGQKSPADPSLVDAEERTHRSMSAPPDQRPPPTHPHPHPADMSSQQPERPSEHASNVRHIPIFVEGRDEPVLNRAESGKQPPPPPFAPHVDRDQYFADEAGPAGFHHAPNFSRAFGTPSTKGFRQGPQPFMQQKVYPQSAYARGASPQRSQSPRPSPAPQPEHFVKVPVQHEHAAPPPPPRAAAEPEPEPAPAPAPQREQTPPHAPPKPSAYDPITQILSIQTDVLNLMTEVENFAGTKKDKRYLFLDEMLTRNLIKLDNIETEGKENIRLARKEAIRCIQKCISVLEAKAESNSNPQKALDVVMKDSEAENGEVEMKEEQSEPRAELTGTKANSEDAAPMTQEQPQDKPVMQMAEAAPAPGPQEEPKPSVDKPEELNKIVEDKPSPKKKVVKKRDKSKDKASAAGAEAAKDNNKVGDNENTEVMQVDSKGDKAEQLMEIDGAASQ